MAFSLVTSGKGVGNNNPTTGSLDTTGATFLVVTTSYGGSPTGVTDSKGNTWTARTAYTNTGISTRIYYVNSNTPNVGTGHTFTLNGTGIAGAINVLAFSGGAAVPYDTENGANSTSTSTLQTGSVTPSEDNCVLITGLTGGNTYGGAGTIDLGFSITDNSPLTGGSNYGSAAAYLIQTTATARNPTWTLGSTVANVSTAIAVFKAAAAVSAIKTVDGLAKASVKTVNGLAIASVKTINGLE